jgi:hypothetical protein
MKKRLTPTGHWSSWYSGTEAEWNALPIDERDNLSFQATGCSVVYPTWDAPVDCCHLECRIRRHERPRIALTNAILRNEQRYAWLRFCSRDRAARIFRVVRKAVRQTGIYDPWKLPGGWMVFVQASLDN